MPLEQWVLAHEATIRLSFFLGIFALVGLWELLSPQRALVAPKGLRWASNLGLVVLNTVITRLLFPMAAVGVAAFCAANGWGLLNQFTVPTWLAVLLAVVVMDFVIWLQHVTFHRVPVLWRLHRVHHSVEVDETNANFGFNLPWWDRLLGTYRAQPRAGQVGMTIGLPGHVDLNEVARLDGMLMMPFKG